MRSLKTHSSVFLSPALVGLLALAVLRPAGAQTAPDLFDYARPSLKWFSIQTEHFNVLFHHDSTGEGSSRTAQVVARIAEEVYEPITSLYDHRPERVSIILKDFEDYSNGAAYFFDNKIEIWAPSLDSPLRGDHDWLRNVITHEFTHMVQVQATMKANRQMPFLYFQLLDYEDVKRPDVLYGYPDVIVTYPVPVLNNPAWLAEGTAQYQRAFLDYDRWDTHRDMMLRTRVLAGKELTLDEMGGFYSHSSLLREGVYNHGFAFTSYLAATYGEDVLRRVSRALSGWATLDVRRALRHATGVPGTQVYDEWMTVLRDSYDAATADVRANAVEGRLIEEDGFSNFYPKFSPDGRRLAYVSNRGEHFNTMSLYIEDVANGSRTSYHLEGLGDGTARFICSLGYEHKVKSGVGGNLSWHPDGARIAYARTLDTPEGFRFSDVYEIDLESKKSKRLTRNERAFAPAYSPDGDRIAYVGHSDGSTNLFVMKLGAEGATRLTSFRDGTQVGDPIWHPSGEWIFFSQSMGANRDLFRVRAGGESNPEPVVATEADERTPAVDPSGTHVYYVSDQSGIFNLYRIKMADLEPRGGERGERLTNVLGGAFMPDVAADGRVAFARYDWDGYKIAMLDEPAAVGGSSYVPPVVLFKPSGGEEPSPEWTHLTAYDDTDLAPLPGTMISDVARTESFPLPGGGRGSDPTANLPALQVEPYGGASFTSFSFYPVLRFDNYSSRRESAVERRLPARTYGETLARNTKVGMYVSSREILEEMSLLGGLLVGPASRPAETVGEYFSPSNLLKLERDAFLIFDYRRGFRFLPRRWSPQISIELYNVRRNVENGLSIEEFPCTACFPDTTLVNLAYSLWEADLYARSKISRGVLAEVGYRYSPYRVITDRFFSKEADQFVPETGSRYFIGRAFTAGLYFESDRPHRHSNVLPARLQADLHYEYEVGRLLEQFDVEDGLLVPSYQENGNHRLTLDARVGLRLPGLPRDAAHGIGLRFRGSTLLGAKVDDFYNDYVGGLIGARGYAFYALGGNETLWLQASYQFPILPDISRQLLFAYFDKLYGRVYADAAMAWSGVWPGLGAVRKDVGAELRLGLGSFYLLPTAVFLSATYGLDAFDFQLDEGFLTPDGRSTVRYGHELLWHFGILFDFDL